MGTGFCPQCGTPRVGALRFCRSCGFDFDAVPETAAGGAAVPPTGPTEGPMATAGIAVPSVDEGPGPPFPSITTAANGRRRAWVVLGAVIFVAVAGAIAFVGLGSSGALSPRHTIDGTFELNDSDTEFSSISTTGGTCKGTGGYSDMGPGRPVTVRDDTGKILASTTLGTGTGSSRRCVWVFTLPDVPEVSFYAVEVGRRGEVTYSLADMKANDWTVSLTLGD